MDEQSKKRRRSARLDPEMGDSLFLKTDTVSVVA